MSAQTCALLRRAVNAARKEHDKALARRVQPGFPRSLLGANLGAALPALEAVAAQLDFVRALRERHITLQLLAVARHNLVRTLLLLLRSPECLACDLCEGGMGGASRSCN